MQLYINLAFDGIIEGLIVAMTALSVTLVFALARFPNAATGEYMTIAAYTTKAAIPIFAGSLMLGSIIGLLAGAALGVLSYVLVFRPLARRPAIMALVASFGISLFLRNSLALCVGYDPQVFDVALRPAFSIARIRVQFTDLVIVAVAAATLAVVFCFLEITPLGRRIRAVADNPDLASVSGIRRLPVMLALWTLVGCVSAIAGILLGLKSVIEPEMGWSQLLAAYSAAILGGAGNTVGAVLGGILIGFTTEIASPLVGDSYKLAVPFLVILIVLMARPNGLLGKRQVAR